MKGYVDDGRQISELIIRGTRYVKEMKRFLWRKDWEDIDNMENKPDEVRIAEICLPAMNTVNPNLKFTVETAYDFPDQRLATLDFAVEEVRGIIHYTYFQKSMKTPLVLMAKSAMGKQQKYSIMTNELIRRMSNVRGNTGQNEKNRVINQYTKQLKNSGYTRAKVREIIVCGLLGLVRKEKRRMRQGEYFHRKASKTLVGRYKKKLTGKSSWFKTKNKDVEEARLRMKETRERIPEESEGEYQQTRDWEGEYSSDGQLGGGNTVGGGDVKSVIFVPYTPGSKLAKLLRENEQQLEKMTGNRVKIQERTGIQLEKMLTKSNPWSGEQCNREECLLCETKMVTGKGLTQNCTSRSVLYETWCENCEKSDREVEIAKGNTGDSVPLYKYVGETSRSVFERGLEHSRDSRLYSTSSHFLKHYLDRHVGEERNGEHQDEDKDSKAAQISL